MILTCQAVVDDGGEFGVGHLEAAVDDQGKDEFGAGNCATDGAGRPKPMSRDRRVDPERGVVKRDELTRPT